MLKQASPGPTGKIGERGQKARRLRRKSPCPIDKHAYSVSKSVYAKTPRAEVAAPGDADND
jgi:hypothetical protein